MHDDVYQMYLEEIGEIEPCTPQEEARLLTRLKSGDEAAKSRLMEGKLADIVELVKPYADQGLPMGDLIQEANLALIMVINQYQDGDFNAMLKAQIEECVQSALEAQKTELQVEEEVAARVNVLKDISQTMAEELGREATVEELAEKMKMSVDEIKDIMKLTLDAITVSPDAGMEQ